MLVASWCSSTHAILQPLKLPTAASASTKAASFPPAEAPIHLRIDGKWVDVSDWADKHPGGRYVLEWADGFDVTGAFHTIHLFSSKKASAILDTLPEADLSARRKQERVLPLIERSPGHGEPTGMDRFMNVGEQVVQLASSPTVPTAPVPVTPAADLSWQQAGGNVIGESALKRDLEEMLRRNFNSPAEYKATPEHWARIGGALALWAVCFAGWVQGDTLATLFLPYAQWLVFSPTVHEASHSTLSTRPWVNNALAYCGMPFIYHPQIWWPQHIVSHHQYTGDDALDVDLHHLRPARLHPGCEVDGSASGANFIFKGYFSTMGMALLWPLRNLQGKSTGRWYENLVTPKPEAVGDREFALSLAPVAFVIVWPWLLVLGSALGLTPFGHDVNALHGFFLWYYPWAVTGAIWTVMTQVSHVQEDCQRPPSGDDPDDYFRWQIESALDYSVGSELVPKLTASLSLQSMHHVMPSVCGCHFHGLYPEYAEICERHGVRLNTRKDVSAAWRSCIARVFELSSPERTPAWALHEPSATQGGLASLTEHLPLIVYLATPGVVMLACTPLF